MTGTDEPKSRSAKANREVGDAVRATEPKPVHEREYLRVSEVPVYLKYQYNMTVSIVTVQRWLRHGIGGKRLPKHLLAGTHPYVLRAELDAFVEPPGEKPAP